MKPAIEYHRLATRRQFFNGVGLSIGGLALPGLLEADTSAATRQAATSQRLVHRPLEGLPHFAPRAKRLIYLHMNGAPSQLDLFDYKPLLNEKNGQELPDSVRQGQRLTGMSANQATLPLAGSIFKFQRQGQSGAWVSDLLPHTTKVIDELCLVKSMYTEAINHDPAITFFQTGSQIAGRPSMGAWLSYGLGSTNENLPAFCVLVTKDKGGQPLYARLWGSGFLPHQLQPG